MSADEKLVECIIDCSLRLTGDDLTNFYNILLKKFEGDDSIKKSSGLKLKLISLTRDPSTIIALPTILDIKAAISNKFSLSSVEFGPSGEISYKIDPNIRNHFSTYKLGDELDLILNSNNATNCNKGGDYHYCYSHPNINYELWVKSI